MSPQQSTNPFYLIELSFHEVLASSTVMGVTVVELETYN